MGVSGSTCGAMAGSWSPTTTCQSCSEAGNWGGMGMLGFGTGGAGGGGAVALARKWFPQARQNTSSLDWATPHWPQKPWGVGIVPASIDYLEPLEVRFSPVWSHALRPQAFMPSLAG